MRIVKRKVMTSEDQVQLKDQSQAIRQAISDKEAELLALKKKLIDTEALESTEEVKRNTKNQSLTWFEKSGLKIKDWGIDFCQKIKTKVKIEWVYFKNDGSDYVSDYLRHLKAGFGLIPLPANRSRNKESAITLSNPRNVFTKRPIKAISEDVKQRWMKDPKFELKGKVVKALLNGAALCFCLVSIGLTMVMITEEFYGELDHKPGSLMGFLIIFMFAATQLRSLAMIVKEDTLMITEAKKVRKMGQGIKEYLKMNQGKKFGVAQKWDKESLKVQDKLQE